MKDGKTAPWGAMIERGTVIGGIGGDEAILDVASLDRPGATFWGLHSDTRHPDGTPVYFFAFEDGMGRVIGPMGETGR